MAGHIELGPGDELYVTATPLAMAVIFAMLASYFLSRTGRAHDGEILLKEEENEDDDEHAQKSPGKIVGWFTMVHDRFNQFFEKTRDRYMDALGWSLEDHTNVVMNPTDDRTMEWRCR